MSMNPGATTGGGRAFRVLLGAAAFVVVVAGVRAAEPILVPLLVAMFVAILVAPPLGWLRRHGFSAVSATIVVVLVVMVLGLLGLLFIGGPISDFLGDLPRYRAQVRQMRVEALGWLGRFGLDVSGLEREGRYLNTDDALEWVGGLVRSVGDLFGHGLLILFTVVFLLAEAAGFPDKLGVLPHATAEAALRRLGRIVADVRRYMIIKAWISLLNGSFIAVWCWVIGVKYPMLWGLLAFLTNFIPNIGALLGAVPAVLVAVLDKGFLSGTLLAAGFLIEEMISGYVLEPRWMGHDLGISTLVVFLSLVFWGWVLGPTGMLLSVPLTIAVKIALESDPDTRWIAVLLGSGAEGREVMPKPAAVVAE